MLYDFLFIDSDNGACRGILVTSLVVSSGIQVFCTRKHMRERATHIRDGNTRKIREKVDGSQFTRHRRVGRHGRRREVQRGALYLSTVLG